MTDPNNNGNGQTRFSFYNAEEYKVSPNKNNSNAANNNDARFSFYDAHQVQLTQTVVQTVEQQQPNEPSTASHHQEQQQQQQEDNVDSIEILKSLQEHEQQRLSILGVGGDGGGESIPTIPNGSSSNVPPIDTTTTTTMLPHATHPNELQQGAFTDRSIGSATPSTLHLNHLPNSNNNNDNALKHNTTTMEQHNNDISDESTNNPYQDAVLEALDILSTKQLLLGEQYAQEISQRRAQRKLRMEQYALRLAELKQDMDDESSGGPKHTNNNNTTTEISHAPTDSVERVLLAILERAHSRDDTVRRSSSEDDHATNSQDSDALLRAMSDLLGPKPSQDESVQELEQRLEDLTMEEDAVDDNHRMFGEDDDLTQETQQQEEDRRINTTATTTMVQTDPTQHIVLSNNNNNATFTSVDSIPAQPDEPSVATHDDNLSAEPSLGTQEDQSKTAAAHQELDGLVERVFQQKESDKLLAARRHNEEDSSLPESLDGSHADSDSYSDSSSEDDEYQGVLGPLSKRSGSGVVLERPITVVRSMEEASVSSSNSSSSSEPTILESLSAAVSFMTGSRGGGKDKYDRDSDDDEETELIKELCGHLWNKSRAPEWDDSDPDEIGYRIVRLNTEQLQHIEVHLEKILDAQTFDDDLKEAEKLLQEQQVIKPPKTPNAEDGGEALANFPGVRSAGKGEMGDLEYFMLPVIFKSHVTGFEPTKDIVLEAGNVVAGQYLVEGVLGSAAFSTAYKCIDLNSEEDSSGHQDEVCLKVIKNTKDFFDQSLDEIKILELLRQTGQCHDNYIVEMRTFFYHREHLIIVTELLRQNLFEFGKFIIDSGEEPYFTMTRLSYITRQCLIALNFVHNMGLVHSDVKPENILLSSYSRANVKLIDFGSSCYLTDRQSSYIQSRSYRAPEVCLGLPYDGRIDIWSLGCVVAEMYTGEVTFQNDSLVSMLSRIEAICGPFPRHMIAQGRQSSRFFTKCGLLYEKVEDDNRDDESDAFKRRKNEPVDVFQPKRTCLASRLGFAHDLMDRYDSNKSLSYEEKRQAMFTDLVRKLLIIDPAKRLTAAEALEHPLMKYAATLTEEDVIYPSE